MTRGRLVLRSLAFYWRTNIAVVLGVATAVAVLAGALLVGDSVRGSLRELALTRLGGTDRAVLSSGYFREALADEIRGDAAFKPSFDAVCPLIVTEGLVTAQASGRRASRVRVYGIDNRFWRFHEVAAGGPDGRQAFVSRALASELGAAQGASIVVRVQRPSDIPIESLHGRKDNLGRSVRLTVANVLEPRNMGDFSLMPSQGDVRAVFVPLRRLQQDLDVPGRVNALLVGDRAGSAHAGSDLQDLVRRRFALEDVGLSVRTVENGRTLAVESPAGLLDAPRRSAVEQAAAASAMKPQPVLTYLANAIRRADREVPYSLVTAMPLSAIVPGASAAYTIDQNSPAIVLNDWAARDLGAKIGDRITLDYYVWEEPGRLSTRTAGFTLAAIVPIAGAAADRDLAPVYPGITEARTLADWDPPFPIDLKRIRRADEDYWDRYRTTPKAFIAPEVGRELWRSRFGEVTSIRLQPPSAASTIDRDAYVAALRSKIDPLAMGLMIRDVRADALAASRGATDFGEYFTYFSFFLVVAALMLAALFFRLGIEQRAREVGLLRAVGYTPRRLRWLFTAEGIGLTAAGSVLGVAGAVAYGAAMMAGLRTWWSGAVGTTALRLHVVPTSLVIGAAGAFVAAVVCIWWTLRGLSRLSERALLAGDLTSARRQRGASAKPAVAGAVALAVLAIVLLTMSFAGRIDRAAAFFGAGTALLVACLCGVAAGLKRSPHSAFRGGRAAVWHVGTRNASERPGRSVLAIGVIASATFIVIAVDAFRRDAPPPTDRQSGVGGYPLLVDLMVPIVNDPNSRDGREALGLQDVDSVKIDPFRVLPGDDASCLNLYEPRHPRVLGVSAPFIAAGRFAFQQSLASTGAERANPWTLLDRQPEPGIIPAIADANSMTYVLHKNLGDDVVVSSGGRSVRLRLVAALADSMFQSELLIRETDFIRSFPDEEGYRFLLVDTPPERADAVGRTIEEGAADLGADAASTTARLAEFHTVENTYLSTFQMLGGLGLLVGTLGLAAVVLRNVLERRRELALLGAVGYTRRHIFTLILAENIVLLGWGLLIGAACALVAIAPSSFERGGRLPATSAGALLVIAVFAAGLLSSFAATRAALRSPLVGALRSE